MYDEYLKVNTKFKSSVNLQYDLFNKDKILNYIPTTDLCDVIKIYVNSILNEGVRSSFLAGPYGKGKSYLMLVLAYLLSKKYDKKTYGLFLEKFKQIDYELYELLIELEIRKIHLIPIIISNNNFDDFNQNFMFSLRKSLLDYGITDIIPTTAYSEALDILSLWEKDQSEDFDILKKCLVYTGINIDELKKGLLDFNPVFFKKFEELYKCVTHVNNYNPLSSNDISAVYSDVAFKVKKYGYSGLFVIFDEFGSFLENKVSDFSLRLNKIQSFAEKASSSGMSGQLHLCCVTHKEMSMYCKDKNQLIEFEKISGRFRNIKFDRSLDENYQIICSAIEKNNGYLNLVDDFLVNNSTFVDSLFNSNIFSNKEQIEYVIKNGFPINPVSLFALVQVSEKVAQNERTLFTFVSDLDVSGFNYFIHNNSEGLLNVNIVYDYFEQLIKENEEYKFIYYKVESLKRLSVKEEEHQIFKTIAIIKIINDFLRLNSTIDNIAFCLNKDKISVTKVINSLITRNLLKENINDHSIDFAVIADKDVIGMINLVSSQQYSHINIANELSKINDNKYYISNKYNFENSVTRYYSSLFLESSKLCQLHSIDSLFENIEGDGLIIDLINDNKMSYEAAVELIKKYNKKNLILRYVKTNILYDVEEKIRKILAAKQIINEKNNISETVKGSLVLYIGDLTYEVKKYFKKTFESSKCVVVSLIGDFDLKECIYQSLKNTYPRTVIFNNEMINKNCITPISLKARTNVIDMILRNDSVSYNNSSAESTIFQSFVNSVNMNISIIDDIEKIITSSYNGETRVNCIVDYLSAPPIGMRNGIIPLFVSWAIRKLSITSESGVSTVLLFNEIKEIDMNAINLTKALTDPKKYRFIFTKINKEKLEMVRSLLDYFGYYDKLSFNDVIDFLIKSLKTKVSYLDPIILKSSINDNLLDLSEEALKFKSVFMSHDINKYKILFETIYELAGNSYKKVPKLVSDVFLEYEKKEKSFFDLMICDTKKVFHSDADSLKSCVDIWKTKQNYFSEIIFDGINKKINKSISIIQFNDFEAMNLLSYAILNCSIQEWTELKKERFFEKIKSFKDFVEEFNPTEKILKTDLSQSGNLVLSSLGKTFYTNISDIISEYGDSLSNEEKARVLQKILEEIVN